MQFNRPINASYQSLAIAHAGGGMPLNGNTYTYLNCQESFDIYYADGTRYFEYDLAFTLDKKIVGVHDWSEIPGYSFNTPMTSNEYSEYRILNQFKGVTLEFLFDTIENYPDIKIILDTKEFNEIALYLEIINQAEINNINIYNCFIPQIYSTEMFDILKEFNFKEFIFTCYKSTYSNNKILKFVNSNDKITILTMTLKKRLQMDITSLLKKGKRVAIHTLNTNSEIDYSFASGASLIYTDYVTENQMQKIAQKYYNK